VAGKAALFDLDGTLTDPGTGIFNSVSHAVAAMGLPPLSEDQLRAFVGPPLQESFAELGLNPSEVTEAVASYREYFGDSGLYENAVYAGIPEALERLRNEGFELGVATSKPGAFAELILEHFDLAGFFTTVVGSELDGSRRHKDEIIAACLEQLPNRDVIAMVGDRAQDVVGAAAHAMPCVGVTWGYAGDGELARAGAVAIVDTPTELSPALTVLASR
jgi:phosphoglycolate phosphatase